MAGAASAEHPYSGREACRRGCASYCANVRMPFHVGNRRHNLRLRCGSIGGEHCTLLGNVVLEHAIVNEPPKVRCEQSLPWACAAVASMLPTALRPPRRSSAWR